MHVCRRQVSRLRGSLHVGTAFQHGIDQAVLHCLIGRHEVVTVGIIGNGVEVLASVVRENAIELLTDGQDFLGVNLDIRGLTLIAAQRLVLAAWPMHTVDTSGLMNCMVS